MLKLKKENMMDLADYIMLNDLAEYISQQGLHEIIQEEEQKGMFGNVFVNVKIDDEPVVIEYMNNGTCFF
jgi:hypothetical protein